MNAFLLASLFAWLLVGSVEQNTWDNLTPPERYGILQVILQKSDFFKKNHCAEAEFRVITDGTTASLLARCSKHEEEVMNKTQKKAGVNIPRPKSPS